jgi:hypothetical protein
MGDPEVVIRTFTTEADAAVAQAILEANGISAAVRRQDAGGMLPSIPLGSGVLLVVAAEDAESAREILEAGDG